MASSDIFYKVEAQNLLKNRRIFFFGDSNVRALYKDLVWLIEYGTLIPKTGLKRKNEPSFAQDVRLSNAPCTNSLTYEEVRRYAGNGTLLQFEFLTRVFQKRFRTSIANMNSPSLLVINSCLWDISRYGPFSIDEFKLNLIEMIEFIRQKLSEVQIVWITTLPPSPKCRGGFLNEDIKFLQSILPFHVVQANEFVADTLRAYNVDILDLHYHLKFLIEFRGGDGIHWTPTAVRFMTNLLLTHISICWGCSLPGRVLVGGKYGMLSNLARNVTCFSETQGSNNNGTSKRAKRRRNRKRQASNFRRGKKNHYRIIDFTKDTFF
ncbi:hypothetical protein Trydic_g20386 [Trypoxylus dichotomus]